VKWYVIYLNFEESHILIMALSKKFDKNLFIKHIITTHLHTQTHIKSCFVLSSMQPVLTS